MSMLCRPKAFEGDKIWTNWEEAAVFCSGTDRRYHLRVKLDENPQPASDGPDFSMFGPAVRGTASLPNTWDRSNSSEHDPDFTRHCDIPIAATPTHSLCSEFDSEINVNQNAGSGLACWCGTSPISVVSVDGVLLNRSCPEHPCWDQTRRVISVETVWDKRCPARSTYNLFDIVNQSGLYYRHRPELIPVIRGSGEYFAMLFEDTKRQANEAERERLHDQQLWDNLGGDPESAGFTRQGKQTSM